MLPKVGGALITPSLPGEHTGEIPTMQTVCFALLDDRHRHLRDLSNSLWIKRRGVSYIVSGQVDALTQNIA